MKTIKITFALLCYLAHSHVFAFPNAVMIDDEIPFNSVNCLGRSECKISENAQFERTEISFQSVQNVENTSEPFVDTDQLVSILKSRAQVVVERAYFAILQFSDNPTFVKDRDQEMIIDIANNLDQVEWMGVEKAPHFNGEKRQFAILREEDGNMKILFHIPVLQEWVDSRQNFDAILMHELALLHSLQESKAQFREQDYEISSAVISLMSLGRIARLPTLATDFRFRITFKQIQNNNPLSYDVKMNISIPLLYFDKPSFITKYHDKFSCKNLLGPDWERGRKFKDNFRFATYVPSRLQNLNFDNNLTQKYDATCTRIVINSTPFDYIDVDSDGVPDIIDKCYEEGANSLSILGSLTNYGQQLGCPLYSKSRNP